MSRKNLNFKFKKNVLVQNFMMIPNMFSDSKLDKNEGSGLDLSFLFKHSGQLNPVFHTDANVHHHLSANIF